MASIPHRSPADVAATGTLARPIVYPLKSAGGVALDAAEVQRHGLALDRRWMLVDRDGTFLSQRSTPRLALLRVEIGRDELVVRAPEGPSLHLDLHPRAGRELEVTVWGDRCAALAPDRDADAWFARVLGRDVRLVYLPEAGLRRVDPAYARPGDRVGFADGYPFLLASEASLADLNGRLATPLPMDRFRPNLIVRGFGAFAEDGWSRLRIGDLTFRVVKPCARCVITTVDQATAELGREPLRTLARFRRVDGKVMFGQNLVHDGTGTLRAGDEVRVEA